MNLSTPPTNAVISIERAIRTSDGAGGKTEAWLAQYTGLAASIRFFSQMTTMLRTESGSGVTESDEMLVSIYSSSLPTVFLNDVVVDANEVRYTVIHAPKVYTQPVSQLQLRVRRLQ